MGQARHRRPRRHWRSEAPFGTYNVTQSGDPLSWAGIAREVFDACGRDPGDITGVTTQQYTASKVVSPRPRHSALSLTKLAEAGYHPADQIEALRRHLDHPRQETS